MSLLQMLQEFFPSVMAFVALAIFFGWWIYTKPKCQHEKVEFHESISAPSIHGELITVLLGRCRQCKCIVPLDKEVIAQATPGWIAWLKSELEKMGIETDCMPVSPPLRYRRRRNDMVRIK